mgnify:CR=1 FL=1
MADSNQHLMFQTDLQGVQLAEVREKLAQIGDITDEEALKLVVEDEEMFKKYPPKYIYVNSKRQLCAMNGEFEKYNATAICYCWFIWQKNWKGETVIRWI